MKFSIRTLLTHWPKPYTKAGNFPPKGRKLVFSLFEITFLNVSRWHYIFGKNVKSKKIIPKKIFYKDAIHSLTTSEKKARNFTAKVPKKEVPCGFLQNNVNKT